MEQLLAFISKKEGMILDVACGKGATTKYLTRYYDNTKVIAINISEKQLETSCRNAPGCRFLKMDAANLSFRDESFHAVVSVEAACHFKTRERFLREAHRVLLPGGYLVLSDILFAEWAERLSPTLVWENHVNTLSDYEESLRRTGFAEIVVRDVTKQVWGGHILALVRFLREKLYSGQMELPTFNQIMFTYWKKKLPALRYYVLVKALKA
jgi:ubiquinone/menaquinone biosynthesis C-methylase UbiE